MILCIGEILADMIGEYKNGSMRFDAYCGGAPFNLAVGAKRSGAKVGFIGRVGNDPVGKFVQSAAARCGLDMLEIQCDKNRNTTIAFVTLNNGERDFAFYRHDTADYHIDISDVDFGKYNIVHVGSLMLSEACGVALADEIFTKVKNSGGILSFDVNFRKDLYPDFDVAKRVYAPFIDRADIVKFSLDELSEYSECDNMEAAAKSVMRENDKDRLLIVTLGDKGSAYYYNGLHGVVPTCAVKPVDTTGAGDAFFGAFLASIEGKIFDAKNIEAALAAGNAAGGAATQFKGAIKL